MTVDEAKKLYPGRQAYQFEPLAGLSVGDSVCWIGFSQEKEEGIVLFFSQFAGSRPRPPGWKMDPDFTCVRIHQESGKKLWKEFWKLSKTKS